MTPAILKPAALSGLFLLTVSALWTPPPVFLVNESHSLPRGLYLRDFGARTRPGAVVALRPPPAAGSYLGALKRRADGLLLKQIAALPGETVCADGAVVATPRRTVSRRAIDRHGRRLPSWTGCRRLAPTELFLLGASNDSFDGRYFGVVAAADLHGMFKLVLRW